MKIMETLSSTLSFLTKMVLFKELRFSRNLIDVRYFFKATKMKSKQNSICSERIEY